MNQEGGVSLTGHDWIQEELPPWNQQHIRQAQGLISAASPATMAKVTPSPRAANSPTRVSIIDLSLEERPTVQMQDFVDRAAAKQFMALQPRPTAVFCVNDPMAFVVLALAREQGIRIPQELSVVGFSDLREASVVTPRLTTVRQDPQAIGRRAAQVLLQRITGGVETGTNEMIQLVPTLVVRESTAPVGG